MKILNTEKRNEKTTHIDKMTAEEMMRVMQDENYNAVRAIESELPVIAKAVEQISARIAEAADSFTWAAAPRGALACLTPPSARPPTGYPTTP